MPVLARCVFKHTIAKDNTISTAILILHDCLFQPYMLSVGLLCPILLPVIQQAGAGEATGEPNFVFSYTEWCC